ncbi:hypothetical protein J2X69_003097 [Algoriphagus sp. 4150]|uniref:DUF4221 family protein n=1 Tax=Algoriphagus sp. 4150 TaxID=2817756 RepID=UPI00285F3F73|nr:DUF4221 family protein [Algoriphagus sp. 4150]MDR7130740.1 hypothetical protein [Algoriphagus sp. 4150]
MRLFVTIAFLLILQACSQKEDKHLAGMDHFRISLDTVLVDAGEEFLYLNNDLYYSSLSPEKDYLINFNQNDFTAEKIDLNELKLLEKIQFEKEGPNGLGSYPRFKVLGDQNLLFWKYSFYKIFDQQGQLVKNLDLDKIAAEYLGSDEYYPRTLLQDQNNPSRIVGLIVNWESDTYILLDFDLTSQSFKKIDLPELEKKSEFKVDLLYEGSPAGSYGTWTSSQYIDGKILISTNTFNEVQVFDLESDSLYVKSWDTPLLGSKRSYIPPKEVERTSGELKEIIRKAEEDISYREFVWDDKNERFFRFSEKKHFGEELNGYGDFISTGSDVFLSVFDKDFNLIFEAEISELAKLPLTYFTKDGNIWMFENIDDELAFIIVKVEVL